MDRTPPELRDRLAGGAPGAVRPEAPGPRAAAVGAARRVPGSRRATGRAVRDRADLGEGLGAPGHRTIRKVRSHAALALVDFRAGRRPVQLDALAARNLHTALATDH